LHLTLTVLTAGIWSICLFSAIIKRSLWPWRCEHCGWHEPDFRSPEERRSGAPKSRLRSGEHPPTDDEVTPGNGFKAETHD
jgi:hypothetical protein